MGRVTDDLREDARAAETDAARDAASWAALDDYTEELAARREAAWEQVGYTGGDERQMTIFDYLEEDECDSR